MKKLLILVDKISEKKELFASIISKSLKEGNEAVLVEFSDLVFEIQQGEISVSIINRKEKLSDFDFVYFRRAGNNFISYAGAVAISLDFLGIKYVDTSYGNLGRAGDKFTSLIRLAANNFPVMPTYFCWRTKIKEKYDEIAFKLGSPFVAKNLTSQRGIGVFLIKNKEDFENLISNFPDKQFLFQKFSESKDEYRILVLEDKVGAFEKKIRTDLKEFRRNIALGAKEEFIDENLIPAKIKKIALRSCRILEIQIGGVDILVDQNSKNWILEVNRGPGLTYDENISPELKNISRYFEEKLSESK